MKKLGFIGGGNMAEALARGLIQHKVFKPADIIVSDVAPERRRKLARTLKVATTADNTEVLRESPAILLAVKPQTIDDVLSELAAMLAKGTKGKLFISIAAGITIDRLTRGLGKRDGCGGERSSEDRGLAHQFEQLCPRLGPHDRFIGRAEGFKHPRQAILLLLGFRFFVGPIEISQGEGDVFREPLQEFDEFGRERTQLR